MISCKICSELGVSAEAEHGYIVCLPCHSKYRISQGVYMNIDVIKGIEAVKKENAELKERMAKLEAMVLQLSMNLAMAHSKPDSPDNELVALLDE